MTASRAIVAVVLVALLCGGLASAQSIGDARRDLAAARDAEASAGARARRLAFQALAARSEVDQIRARAVATAAQIQQAEASISAAEARITVIERLRAAQRARLAEQQGPTIRLVAALQSLARRPAGVALVQPGSVADIVHVRAALAGVMPLVMARTAAIRAEVARGRALRVEANTALASLRARQADLVTTRNMLAQQAIARRRAAAELNSAAIVEQDRALVTAEDARDIGDLVARLDSEAGQRSRLASLPGPLMRPARPGEATALPDARGQDDAPQARYRLPAVGRIVRGMGEVSDAGVRSRGLTIATQPGAQVVAPTGGRVAFAGPYRGYGTIVIIDHGNGWTSLITDLAAIDAAVGDTLDPGAPIGRAGDARPTITLELRHNGTPVDIARVIG